MAVERKLKYCPMCGSFVKFDCGNFAIYKLITWRCANVGCYFSRQDQMLSAWNYSYPPSTLTRILEVVNRVWFYFYEKWAVRKIKKANIKLCQ